jgi:metal iron transporter
VAGCALTIVDVLVILIFYNPSGSMRRLRAFEFFVMALVLGVVICFCIELSLIKDISVGEVFKGYLPSSTIVQGQGIFLSTGILGATVMPHSLYLGSGVVQSRLRDFDTTTGNLVSRDSIDLDDPPKYRPSIAAIRSCLTYSIVEIGVSLFTFALFVNSAILIVAGASLSSNPRPGTRTCLASMTYCLERWLQQPVSFSPSRFFSGTSAGIICTIAAR